MIEEMWKNSAIIAKRNVDSNQTPISINLSEMKQIIDIHSCVVLNQLPDENYGIQINNFVEVFDIEDVTTKSYKVDYANGVIYFHPNNVGKMIQVNYYGTGYTLLSASRIYTKYDKYGNVLETLEELIDKAKLYIKAIETLGGAVEVINKLDVDIETGISLHENLANDIEITTPLQEDLHSDIVEANTFREQLNQDVANGAVLSSELRQNVIDGENINADLEYNLVEGQGAIDLIRGTGNTAKIITTSDWVGTAPNLSYTWNHGLGTKNLTVEVFDNDTNETLFWTTTLVDNNNIKIESDEAKNIRIVLSAKYHMGGMDTKEEIIAARKGKNDLKTKIDEIDDTVVQTKNRVENILYNVTWTGNTGNGSTDFQPIIQSLINSGIKKLYFPNGEYYFNDIVSLDNIELYFDNDVTLSFPNNWYEEFTKNAVFKDKVKIKTRDRLGNDSYVYPNDYDVIPLINSSEMTMCDVLKKATIQRRGYNGINKKLEIGNYWNVVDSEDGVYNNPNSSYGISALTVPCKNQDSFSMLIQDAGNLSSGGNIGFVCIDTNEEIFYTFKINQSNRTIDVSKYVSGSSVEFSTKPNHFDRYLGSAWNFASSPHYKLTIHRINENTVTLFFNDMELITYETDITISAFGFTGQSLNSNIKFGYPVTWKSDREPINHGLKIKWFGDSLTNGDGSSTSPPLILQKILKGRYGIQNVNVEKISTGGYTAQQIYGLVQETNFSDTDLVIIFAGANDNIMSTDWTTFRTTLRNMYDYILNNTNAKLLVVDVAPQTSYSDTNIGEDIFNSSASNQAYSHIVRSVVAEKNSGGVKRIALARNIVGNNSSNSFEYSQWNNDNVHLTNYGATVNVQSIVNAIVNLYAPNK